MKNISLYINGELADLDGTELILLNYTQEELSNPTVVKNSYSRSITLKGTARNNWIFAHIYRGDKFVKEDYITISHFDPLVRTPFEIYDEMSQRLVSGYVRLDKITRKGAADISYTITLYGGLGGFLYSLSYKEDGSKFTLGDLDWGGDEFNGAGKKFYMPNAYMHMFVNQAWKTLAGSPAAGYPYWKFLNFVPCYNGLPDDFDSDKVVVLPSLFGNVPASVNQDGKEYSAKSDAGRYVLIKMAKKHTEWEMKELRASLQRPCISIKGIMEGIKYTARTRFGYDVEWEERTWVSELSGYSTCIGYYYLRGWVTLPMLPRKNVSADGPLHDMMMNTGTPAEYLLSIAKMFGLVFKYDEAVKKVTIMSRPEFYYYEYYKGILDLTPVIDTDTVEINPITPEARFYQFGKDEAIGEYAKQYKEQYGKTYGIQTVNTGYEMDDSTKVLTDNVGLKAAPEVLEYNRLFVMDEVGGIRDFMVPHFEQCDVELWNKTGDEEKSIKVPLASGSVPLLPYDASYPWADFMPKVQLHDAENKAVDGAGVFLLFDGMETVPSDPSKGRAARFRLTSGLPDSVLEVLNQGTPCWQSVSAADFSLEISRLPSFRRMVGDNQEVRYSVEWGIPLEVANPRLGKINASIYRNFWKSYISDRYSVHTKVIKCKANLSGFEVNQRLMQRVCWYDGAYWVINKIINHSLTTDDLTEMELVKINSLDAYIKP